MGGGVAKPTLYGVNLHVYNLTRPDSLGGLLGEFTGMRALHTGVEIFRAKAVADEDGKVVPKRKGTEYAFGPGRGVWEQTPRSVNCVGGNSTSYRETICMGTCQLTSRQLKSIISVIKAQWPGEKYDVLSCNCNHFSDALIFTLLQKHIPESINRFANTASAAIGMVGGVIGGLASILTSGQGQASSLSRSGPEIEELPS